MGPAPRPVDDRNRLAPEFVAWMQAFPTDWNEGESRTNRLKQLGNAVVWLQAYRALELLFQRVAGEATWAT